jgi:hypothetical protein
MLRHLVCFTLLILLAPALAAAQRCDLHCALSVLGHAAAQEQAASVTVVPDTADVDGHLRAGPTTHGCRLAHLPALLPHPPATPGLAPRLRQDAAAAGFSSIERAPPEPRPKRA